MATLATESFPGANNATWPAQWTTANANGGTQTQDGTGRGRMLTANAVTFTDGGYAFLSGITATRDLDITFDLTFATITSEIFVVGLRCPQIAGSTGYITNGYSLQINPANSPSIQAVRSVSSTNTNIGTAAGPTFTANTPYRIRFQAIANTVRWKYWLTNASEPGTWNGTITDANLSAATGKVNFSFASGGAVAQRTGYVSNITVTDDGTTSSVSDFSGSVALTGSGTFSSTGVPKPTGTLALSGSGTFSSTGLPKWTGSQSLTGSGTFTNTGTTGAQDSSGSVALTGSGTATFSGSKAVSAALALTGSGTTLSSTGTKATSAAQALSGSGTTDFSGTVALSGSTSPSGSGTLTLSGSKGGVSQVQNVFASASATNTLNISWSTTPIVGNLLVIHHYAGADTAANMVTPPGYSRAAITSATGAGGYEISWRVCDGTEGTSVALTVTTGYHNGLIQEYSAGQPWVSPLDLTAQNGASAGATSLTILNSGGVMAANNEFVISGIGFTPSANSLAATNGYTSDSLGGTGTRIAYANKLVTSKETMTLDYTWSNTTSVSRGAMVSFVVPQPQASTGTYSPSGSGTLTASGTPEFNGSVALSGSGTLSNVQFSAGGTIDLTGSGALTFTGVAKMLGAVGLTGSGTLASTGTKVVAKGTYGPTGSGTLTSSGQAFVFDLVNSVTKSVTTAATSTTFTVPTRVTTAHLGVLIVGTSVSGGTSPTSFTITGWTRRTSNPSAQNNSEVAIFTRNGGHTAGNTITVTSSLSRSFVVGAAWYNSGGFDVALIGTVGGRNTTTSTRITIPGVTTTGLGQGIVVVATERTTTSGTTLASTTPSALVTDRYYEDTGSVGVSVFFGHYLKSTPGATGSSVITYSGSSSNGVGQLFALATDDYQGTVALSGTGTLTRTGTVPFRRSGTGTLTLDSPTKRGSVALSGSSRLDLAPNPTNQGIYEWNGTTWVPLTARRYIGNQWVRTPVIRY